MVSLVWKREYKVSICNHGNAITVGSGFFYGTEKNFIASVIFSEFKLVFVI